MAAQTACDRDSMPSDPRRPRRRLRVRRVNCKLPTVLKTSNYGLPLRYSTVYRIANV